ncbi:MAG: phenylacetate--CoA ligase family protein, partial [Thermodesulfobacteriota bacterium]
MIDRKHGYFLRQKETMSRKRREAYLTERLSQILRYGYRHSEAIRSKFDALGLKPERVKSLKDLEKIPITKKADLVKAQKEAPPFGGFVVFQKRGFKRIYMSPGPVFEPGEWDYRDTRWAQALFASGIRKGDIVLNTFNYHLTPLALMLDESLQMLGATVIPIGPGNLSIQVQLMRQLHVTGFIGTPSFLMSIVEAAENLHLDFKKDFSLQVAFVGAEMFPKSLREKLEEKL